MPLTQYLHIIATSRILDQINLLHILLARDLHMIVTYRVLDQSSNWGMLFTRYLQTLVSVLVSADVIIKLSKDIYKTKVLQKNRKGVLELNWEIPQWVREKAHIGSDKSRTLLYGFYTIQNFIHLKKLEITLYKSKRCFRLALWNILSFNHGITNLELEEIIDTREVHSLMNNLHKVFCVPIYMTDMKGNILISVGCVDSYIKCHSPHTEALTHCTESGINFSKYILYEKFDLLNTKNYMRSIMIPLKLGGRHVGNIYTGSFFFEDDPVNYKFFLPQTRQKDFNEKEYIAALEKVPRLDREKVDKVTGSLLAFAKVIDDKYLACPLVWAVSRLKNSLFSNSS
jgi:hypothetical protein